ncbi:MAG TPA: FlgD immunoglobulin-like domain containing protein, partial [Bacteroidota bacterium]|nr:FlgD immunoglobulin-like domain containing protein [Bacteroidota bacterium]
KHNAIVPKPKHLSLHQYMANPESYEGLLVEIDTLYKASGTWPAASTGASIYLTNASKMDTAQLYISSSTDVAGSIEPTYPINVVAVINQYSSATTVYNNGYEIEPSDSTNITHTKLTSIVSIAEARKDLNGDLIADHSVTKDTLQIFGVVTTPNLQSVGSQTAYFIQDTSAGVEVFASSLPQAAYAVGDSVMVTGVVGQYRGLVEFVPLTNDTIHFAILKHKAKVPAAKKITFAQFVTHAESYEGSLIEVDSMYYASGTWPAASTSGKIYVTDVTKKDTALVYISSSTNIPGSAAKAFPVNVTGVVSQYTSASTVYNDGYELEPFDTVGIVHTPGTASVANNKTGIPATYELSQNYPNPFNPSTTISFGLPSQSHVTVKVYSILGQEVATLFDGIQGAGYHNIVWNGRSGNGGQTASGVYLLRVVAQSTTSNATFVQVRKMLLLK